MARMDEKPNVSREAAIDRIIEILVSARDRPQMYFDPLGPAAVIDFLYGLQIGVSVFGLRVGIYSRRPALESRGLEEKARWEDDQLRERGLSPAQIVTELLSIEIEMWKCERDSIRSAPHC